jgi:hypothetical protein
MAQSGFDPGTMLVDLLHRDARCSSSKSGKKFSKIVKIGQFREKCTEIRAKNSLIKQKNREKIGKNIENRGFSLK